MIRFELKIGQAFTIFDVLLSRNLALDIILRLSRFFIFLVKIKVKFNLDPTSLIPIVSILGFVL